MSRWTPDRKRLRDALTAALAPLCACAVALGALTAWTGSGRAGSPARLEVTDARLQLPFRGVPLTAAFFRISNSGGSDDRLTGVTSPAVTGQIRLSRHRMAAGNSATGEEVASLPLPAARTLAMSPHSSDVIVPAQGNWRRGDSVPFTLHFAQSDPIEVRARVVRPG
ncbi:copper chaperone PCu(A)C [Streptomyces physcomitrii]|uniref:copper chaperone PCu(A)C n=1 Tax=Streptomyces physcomitrii TaxID=2724184 RepID=UPI0033F9DA2C